MFKIFREKCMKNVKTKRVNNDLQALEDKNLKKIQEENDKLC